MLRLPVCLALLVLAKAQDLLGVDYSFDIDFYRNFDNRKCDSESAWKLVAYQSLDVEIPFTHDKGIQAVGKCCATSFPMYFFKGFLELNVYVQVISHNYRISVEVFDEDNVPRSRYLYGPTTKGFRPGWQTLHLKVNNIGKGYVNIGGRSFNDELVLIDSFRYIPNSTIIHHRQIRRSKSFEKDDAEIIFEFNEHEKPNTFRNQDNYEIDDGSGDENSTPEPANPTYNPVTEASENESFWNLFTIFFVSFGAVVVLSMVAVGGYHCGKIRGRDSIAQPVFADDVEPPRTITIPRVTGVHENRSNTLIFD